MLTYLYRIVLASEADLSVIDLLRRVFAQACKPLLLMISQFTTVGSFEDPCKEFFVEKLMRKRRFAKKVAFGEEDIVYKMTSNQDKIPDFLSDSAVTVFKIGCDINLLKTRHFKSVSENSSGFHLQSIMAASVKSDQISTD